MTLKVLHTSDIHGKYKRILKSGLDFDVWLDTGDWFDNVGRVHKTGGMIIPEVEARQQQRWLGWKQLGRRITEWLDGRPVILLPGNHDFISLAGHLRSVGCPNVHAITPDGVEVAGLKWAGFREIPRIADEWMGEVEEPSFAPLIQQTLSSKPDVLVTHAPPAGILDDAGVSGYGINPLTTALADQPHDIKWHFFGHEHADGGKQVEEMGIKFHNGAAHVLVHELGV